MFKNILLPYSFENDFSNIPKTLKKLTDKDSVVTIYNVITENDLLASVRYENKHKSDIIKEKEQELSPFLEELSSSSINYKIEIDFGPVKDTILEKISSGTLENGQFDLVVMSNHRLSLDIKHVLGDVTHKITKEALYLSLWLNDFETIKRLFFNKESLLIWLVVIIGYVNYWTLFIMFIA